MGLDQPIMEQVLKDKKIICPKCGAAVKHTTKIQTEKGYGACRCNSYDYQSYLAQRKIIKQSESPRQFHENEVLRFVIHGPPRIKKNSQRIFGKRIYPSEIYIIWASRAFYQLETQKQRLGFKSPINEEIHAIFTIYRDRKGIFDLVGGIEGPQDVLTQSGIILDDHLIKSTDGSRLKEDKDNPRVEIILKKFIS